MSLRYSFKLSPIDSLNYPSSIAGGGGGGGGNRPFPAKPISFPVGAKVGVN